MAEFRYTDGAAAVAGTADAACAAAGRCAAGTARGRFRVRWFGLGYARVLLLPALMLLCALLVFGLLGATPADAAVAAATASAADNIGGDGGERFSPLFAASLRNTLREFDEKEAGIFYNNDTSAVTEIADTRDSGAKSVSGESALAIARLQVEAPQSSQSVLGDAEAELYFGMPGIPSVTSGYSCGATCGSTCGSTCGATCGATCGSTCGSTCGATCFSTCTSTCTATCTATCGGTTCGSTCGSTCAGSGTCAGSSSCAGASTCAGQSSCAGASTCAGQSSCAGSSTCAGQSSCAGTPTCYGQSTCEGSTTCMGTNTCSFTSTCTTNRTCMIGAGSAGCIPGVTTPGATTPPSTGGSGSGSGSGGSSEGSQDGEGEDYIPPTGASEPLDEALGDAESAPPDGGDIEGAPPDAPNAPDTPDEPDVPGEPGEPEEPDIPDDWALEEVEKAVASGYVSDRLQSGYRLNITRYDFCDVLVRLLIESDDYCLDDYIDVPSPFEDIDDDIVTCLSDIGIVQGIGEGLFNPYGEITRQEAAVMLRRAALALGLADAGADTYFDDQQSVADWAVEALGFVVENRIMMGVGDNRFDPLGTYTRQQAYLTIIRLAEAVST